MFDFLSVTDVLDNDSAINKLFSDCLNADNNIVNSDSIIQEADLLINSVDEVIRLLKGSDLHRGI